MPCNTPVNDTCGRNDACGCGHSEEEEVAQDELLVYYAPEPVYNSCFDEVIPEWEEACLTFMIKPSGSSNTADAKVAGQHTVTEAEREQYLQDLENQS